MQNQNSNRKNSKYWSLIVLVILAILYFRNGGTGQEGLQPDAGTAAVESVEETGAKAGAKAEEKAGVKTEAKAEEKAEEKVEEEAEEKAEVKAEEKAEEKVEEKVEEKAEVKTEEKAEEKAEVKTEEKTETKPEVKSTLRFRSKKLLDQHYEKHGKEMGFASAAEYEAAAAAVPGKSGVLHKTEKEDGDDVYFLEATDEFVVVSTDGYIRTYFLPDKGRTYFDRQ